MEKNNSLKTFKVRVSGSFSRTYEFQASTREEALAYAKEDWENTPLYFGDSNGENFEVIDEK